VAIRATGISSLVENDVAGILTEDDQDNFSQAIIDLINDPRKRKRLGEAAAGIARKELTASVCTDKLLELYEKAIYNRRKSWKEF